MRAERAGFAVWWVAAATALLLGAGGWAVPREAPPLSALTGVVYDSLHERPLANARVQLQRANLATTTDAAGAFRFADVPAGDDVIWVEHALLDSMGLAPLGAAVRVAAGGDANVALGIPSLRSIRALHCGDTAAPSAPGGIIYGTVNTLLDLPAAPAAVELAWAGAGGGTMAGSIAVNERGAFAACDVPIGTPLWIRAIGPRDTTVAMMVRLHGTGIVRRDLTLASAAEMGLDASLAGDAAASDAVRDGAVLYGEVRESTGAALGGARVAIVGSTVEARTDSAGRYAAPLPPGSWRGTVTRLPYGEQKFVVNSYAGDSIRLDVRLARVTALSTVTVRERAVSGRLDGIAERRMRAAGYFVDSTAIAKATTMLSVLHAPGVTFDKQSGGYVAYTVRPSMSRTATMKCRVSIYVDGQAINKDGPAKDNPDLDAFKSDIAVVEIYPRASMAPLELLAGGGLESRGECGVVVIWTKGFLGKS